MGVKSFFSKEVIDYKTAEKLGHITDLEIEEKTGVITSVIIPERKGLFSLFSAREIKIPWQNIKTVGDDIILVSFPDENELVLKK